MTCYARSDHEMDASVFAELPAPGRFRSVRTAAAQKFAMRALQRAAAFSSADVLPKALRCAVEGSGHCQVID